MSSLRSCVSPGCVALNMRILIHPRLSVPVWSGLIFCSSLFQIVSSSCFWSSYILSTSLPTLIYFSLFKQIIVNIPIADQVCFPKLLWMLLLMNSVHVMVSSHAVCPACLLSMDHCLLPRQNTVWNYNLYVLSTSYLDYRHFFHFIIYKPPLHCHLQVSGDPTPAIWVQ